MNVKHVLHFSRILCPKTFLDPVSKYLAVSSRYVCNGMYALKRRVVYTCLILTKHEVSRQIAGSASKIYLFSVALQLFLMYGWMVRK
jgi:hypothetical protein